MLRFLLAFFVSLSSICYGQPAGKGIVSVADEDGSPEVFPWQVKFSNGSVTDNGDGTASISSGGGGGNVGIGTINTLPVYTVNGADNSGPSNLIYAVSGNVGISTFAPNAMIDISSTANQDLLRVNDNGTGDGSPLIVKADGNVGIGTTIPQGGLAVMNGNVGIGTWIPAGALHVIGSGNVGIGTLNPTAPLEVSGAVRVGIGTTTVGTVLCAKTISGNQATIGYCTGSLTNSICGTCN